MKKIFIKKIGTIIISSMIGLSLSIANIPTDNYSYIYVDATTSADLTISENGVAFICEREGFHSTCYYDGAQSSIGYGTKCGTTAHSSGLHSITQEQAKIDMMNEINNQYIPNVRRQTSGIEMNQNQFDALVSFTYNTGGGTSMIKNSPLVKYLTGELTEAEARSQYSNYVVTSSATGTVVQGLINRRNAEADLFFSGNLSCSCSEDYAGEYIVTTESSNLIMRGGHGSSYSIITTIPKGATVYVSKADGSWAHVEYNGNSGYCSMQYLTRLGSATCNCSESYFGNYTVTTESTDLNMRSEHNSSSSIVTKIPKGATVYVSKADGTWAHVEYEGYTGYCSMQYLTKVKSDTCDCSESYSGNYTVTTESTDLNMRSEHNSSSSIVTKIPKGATVYVSKANGTWAHVEYEGYTGYCSMQYLSLQEPVVTEPIIEPEPPIIEDVYLNVTDISLLDNSETYQLELINADNNNIVWLSKDNSIATIDDSGRITAISNGTTTIYATYNEKAFACSVTVNKDTTPKLSDDNLTITSKNTEYQLEVLNLDGDITWLSADTSVVTVEDGLVIPVSNGTTKVYAIVGTQTFYCEVTVNMEINLLGDCNNDNQVTTSDLLLMKKYIFGLTSSSSINLVNANLNEDYSIDVLDVIMLKSKLFN